MTTQHEPMITKHAQRYLNAVHVVHTTNALQQSTVGHLPLQQHDRGRPLRQHPPRAARTHVGVVGAVAPQRQQQPREGTLPRAAIQRDGFGFVSSPATASGTLDVEAESDGPVQVVTSWPEHGTHKTINYASRA